MLYSSITQISPRSRWRKVCQATTAITTAETPAKNHAIYLKAVSPDTSKAKVVATVKAVSGKVKAHHDIKNLSRVKLRYILTKSTKKKDRKSTRLNSSHVRISYAVFCLKKK